MTSNRNTFDLVELIEAEMDSIRTDSLLLCKGLLTSLFHEYSVQEKQQRDL